MSPSGTIDGGALRHHMQVCRAWVIAIWLCLLAAATLGVLRPT